MDFDDGGDTEFWIILLACVLSLFAALVIVLEWSGELIQVLKQWEVFP